MRRLEFFAMNCRMLAVTEAETPDAARALERIPVQFEGWEQSLSRFRDDSELSRLNRSTGEWVRVSETLWQALRAARNAARQSDGLVLPTLLESLAAAGYDRSFETLGPSTAARETSPAATGAAAPAGTWRDIRLDAWRRSVRLPPGMRLDLGGVAKGWAADRAARLLGRFGPALVDAGGDIAVSGPRPGGQRWPIAVASPLSPGSQLELLLIDRGGVATSGRDYRRWQSNGRWQHHILDPRTGLPAETDVLSATVIAGDALKGETAAKAVLILGSRDGLGWLDARPEFAGLMVMEDGRVIRSRRLSGYLWS